MQQAIIIMLSLILINTIIYSYVYLSSAEREIRRLKEELKKSRQL